MLTDQMRAALDTEDALRRLAPLLPYADNYTLTLKMIALRKAVGLPAMMAVAPRPVESLPRWMQRKYSPHEGES